MKRAALYMRVSTLDQHPENPALRSAQLAQQRGFRSWRSTPTRHQRRQGAPARSGPDAERCPPRPLRRRAGLGLRPDRPLGPALPRSARRAEPPGHRVRQLPRELDTGGPLGRAIVVIIGAIAELERNLIVERVRAGMRRAKLEGRRIGRTPLDIDRAAVLRDRDHGLSLSQIAKAFAISRATVSAASCARQNRLSLKPFRRAYLPQLTTKHLGRRKRRPKAVSKTVGCDNAPNPVQGPKTHRLTVIVTSTGRNIRWLRISA